MSDKKQFITYDTTKNLVADINPAFISGLQAIYGRYLLEFYPDASKFGILIQDFNETIMEPEKASSKIDSLLQLRVNYILYILSLIYSRLLQKSKGLNSMKTLK